LAVAIKLNKLFYWIIFNEDCVKNIVLSYHP
jgi:hypothetical protein